MNSPAGPGRDAALSQLPAQTGNAVAGTLNQSFNTALSNLSNIGSMFGGVGLQAAGGELSGLSGAGQTTSEVGKLQAAASPWNQVGSLFGALGSAVGGTNLKPGSGGGGNTTSTFTPSVDTYASIPGILGSP